MLIAGVKGGLLGAALAVAMVFITGFLGIFGLVLLLLTPIIVGVLGGIFLVGPRNIGRGAGAGAIAAAIAGIAYGIVITVVVAAAMGNISDAQLAQVISERLSAAQIAQAGTTPEQLAQTIRGFGTVGIGLCCIGAGPILWALLGTLGGMIGQSFKPAAAMPTPYLGAGQPYYGQPPVGYDKVNPNYPHPPSVIGGETPPQPGQPLYPPQSPYGQPPLYGQPPYGQPPAGYDRNDPNYPHPPSAIGGETPPPYGQPPGDESDKAR
jgi:hypothetical protein